MDILELHPDWKFFTLEDFASMYKDTTIDGLQKYIKDGSIKVYIDGGRLLIKRKDFALAKDWFDWIWRNRLSVTEGTHEVGLGKVLFIIFGIGPIMALPVVLLTPLISELILRFTRFFGLMDYTTADDPIRLTALASWLATCTVLILYLISNERKNSKFI